MYATTTITIVFNCNNESNNESTMSVTASLLSGYNTIGERWIEEKYKEQRIRKIKSIGRYTV